MVIFRNATGHRSCGSGPDTHLGRKPRKKAHPASSCKQVRVPGGRERDQSRAECRTRWNGSSRTPSSWFRERSLNCTNEHRPQVLRTDKNLQGNQKKPRGRQIVHGGFGSYRPTLKSAGTASQTPVRIKVRFASHVICTLGNTPERTRTSDLRFRKAVLYPAELRGQAGGIIVRLLGSSPVARQVGCGTARMQAGLPCSSRDEHGERAGSGPPHAGSRLRNWRGGAFTDTLERCRCSSLDVPSSRSPRCC